MSKKTSVFLARDLSHAEAQSRGVCVGSQERIGQKAWTHVRLGDYATLFAGGTPSRSVSDYYGGTIPWCSISDISGAGKFLIRTAESLTRLGIENSSAKLIPADAILFAMYASIGECTLATTPLATSQAILGIYNLKEFDREYLYYYLCSQKEVFVNQGQTGTQSNLSKEIVSNIQVPKPDIKEQRRIAISLSSIDADIASVQSLISKYEAIKKATVNLLLKAKVGWRKVKIKDFCPLQRGFDLPKRLRSEGRYPLVCSNGIVDRIDTALQKAPGVVTGRSGTIGSVHYVTEDYWPHNTTLWVTKFIDADPMFVYHLLSNMNLSSFSGGSGVPTLNRNSIHETIISVPTIHKQREIALQISAIDDTLKDCRAQLAKAKSLKQGMMSYFFG